MELYKIYAAFRCMEMLGRFPYSGIMGIINRESWIVQIHNELSGFLLRLILVLFMWAVFFVVYWKIYNRSW